MEHRELIRIVLRRWWLIALPVVLGAVIAIPDLISDGAAVSAGFTAQIRYSAAQKQNMMASERGYTDVWTASEYSVHALTDWVRSASFRAEMAQALGETQASLAGLQIAADNARSVGVVYLSHPDHESLGAIANAAVVVLSSRSHSYFPQFGGDAAQVTILEQPAIASSPPPLPSRLAPVIRLGVALLIGLALAIFAEFADPTIYHQDALRRLGLPVLGSIPKERA